MHQLEYIGRWVELVQGHPDEDAVSARIRVQAAQLVVNDAVQTRHLRSLPGFADSLRSAMRSLLDPEASLGVDERRDLA